MNKTGKACLYFSGISFDKAEELFVTNILTFTLNLLFGVVTFVANSTILLAIKKNLDLHTPSFVLLGCLATSDLLVNLICQPLFVAFKAAELERNLTAYCWLRLLQSRTAGTTSSVSLVAVATVSVDRLLALTLHLRYETLVTVPRVLQVTLKCVELIPDLVLTPLNPLLTVEHLKRSHPTFRADRAQSSQTSPLWKRRTNAVCAFESARVALTLLRAGKAALSARDATPSFTHKAKIN